LDREGSFRYVKGFDSRPIGTEVEVNQALAGGQLKSFAIAACLMLVLFVGSFAWMWNSPEFAVYADINPSVELVFNRFDQLIDVQPLNEDGALLLEGLSLKGSPSEVVVALIQAAEEQGFVFATDDIPAILITVVTNNNSDSDKQISAINAALSNSGLRDLVSVETSTVDFRDQARAYGVSPGKLSLVERLLAADPSISMDDVIDLPVKDLVKQIQEAEGTPSGQDNSNAGPGNKDGDTNNSGSSEGDSSGTNNGNTSSPSNPNAGPGNNSGGTNNGGTNNGNGAGSGGTNNGGTNNGGTNNGNGNGSNNGGTNNGGTNNGGTNNGGTNNGGTNNGNGNGGSNNGGSNNGGTNNGGSNNGGTNNGGTNNGGSNNGGSNNGGSNNGGSNNGGTNNGGTNNGNGSGSNNGGTNNGGTNNGNGSSNPNKGPGNNSGNLIDSIH
jgi:hypothetical protein